ncbi:hypothetical protein [Parvularcula sp. IMCC14364]|uniref:hypothetical protein n=1 Tax=Parvularcula sp. IMCC14364 TaxID=3067902 RepID=UPI0027404FC0|nr:hypothetical protein [Parvularcula sp. IMCC14364]
MTEDPLTPILHPKLALALLATLIVQTITALLWAGAASERLGQLERRADITGELIERTARLEAQNIYMRETLERIERKIDENAQ